MQPHYPCIKLELNDKSRPTVTLPYTRIGSIRAFGSFESGNKAVEDGNVTTPNNT